MTEKEMQEHACKELLKKVVDNGQNYTEKMKFDLKEIIDQGKSPEEICEATLAYFAMSRWQRKEVNASWQPIPPVVTDIERVR